MTPEEAIGYLKRVDITVGKKIKTRTAEALEMAIRALEREFCEDAVSRQEVKENMIKYGFLAPDMTVTEFVHDLQSINPQKWIPISERPPEAFQECLFTVEAFHWANEPVTYKVIQKAYGGEQNFIAWMPSPEPYKAESEC